MTRYSAESLERTILEASIARRTSKNKTFANDDGYWTGGQCNWGGTHNLKEDCKKLVNFFTEITELRQVRKELTNFTNEGEFNKKKEGLIAKTETVINRLTRQENSNTYIADICCIWSDFDKLLNSTIDNFRKAAELLKKDIEATLYNEMKELQKILSDERKLKNEIEDNERKARNEPDENKRKKFVFLVDEAKEKLKKNLERKKQLKTARLGDNFNPDQHIDDFLKAVENKLSGKNRPSRTTKTANPQSTSYSGNYSLFNNNHEQNPFVEKYWKELLLGGAFLLGAYYILNQEEE